MRLRASLKARLPRPGLSGTRRAFAIAALFVAREANAQDGARAIVRTLFGDVALELRVTGPGMLSIGAADSLSAVTLDVRASDARRWVDSATRLIAQGTRRARATQGGPDATVTRRRVVLEEPGVGAGSFILLRTDSAGVLSYAVFASDADLGGVRQRLDAGEASILVLLVRRAVTVATPPRARRRNTKPLAKSPPDAAAKLLSSPIPGATQGAPREMRRNVSRAASAS